MASVSSEVPQKQTRPKLKKRIWMVVWCVPSDGSCNERDPSVRITLFTSMRKLESALRKGTPTLTIEEQKTLLNGGTVDWDENGSIRIYTDIPNPPQLSEGSVI